MEEENKVVKASTISLLQFFPSWKEWDPITPKSM